MSDAERPLTHGERYLGILHRIIGPTEDLTFLDLCCGEMTHTKQMKFRQSLHVDIIDWETRPKEFHFIKGDVLEFEFPGNAFDVCLCSDGIEHFTTPRARVVLESMCYWSKLPIIFTPLGDHLVNAEATDPHTHKSGWTPEEFEEMGWKTEVYPEWHGTFGAFFAWKPRQQPT